MNERPQEMAGLVKQFEDLNNITKDLMDGYFKVQGVGQQSKLLAWDKGQGDQQKHICIP